MFVDAVPDCCEILNYTFHDLLTCSLPNLQKRQQLDFRWLSLFHLPWQENIELDFVENTLTMKERFLNLSSKSNYSPQVTRAKCCGYHKVLRTKSQSQRKEFKLKENSRLK